MRISGTVIKGLGLGKKKLGTPTLNLSPRRIPKNIKFGIYAVFVKTPAGFFKGVAHYGPRPAVKAAISFEVHCFGLKKNLYRKRITVGIKKRLRDVKNFPTLPALKEQIRRDIAKAKKIL